MRVLLRLVASFHQPRCCSFSSFSANGDAKSEKLSDALSYCIKIVRERDFENFLAVLLMRKQAQKRIFTILALNTEIATLRNKIKRGSGVAGINQLTFWGEALETLGQSRTKTLLPRQPVIIALNAFGSRSDVPLLLQLVSARQQTLGDRPFADVYALESNSRQLFGSLISLQMRALHDAISETQDSGNDTAQKQKQPLEMTETAQKAVDAMACAIGILTLIRATVLLLRDGILLLPQDLTSIHGVTAGMAYRQPNSLKAVVQDLCEISDRHLSTARSSLSLGAICPSLRPALLTCGLRADHVLSVLRSNNFNLLDVRLHQRHPMSAWKLWWRNKHKKY